MENFIFWAVPIYLFQNMSKMFVFLGFQGVEVHLTQLNALKTIKMSYKFCP